jgi:predicted ATPase/DNA-binding CsgD family transcriptional regulator
MLPSIPADIPSSPFTRSLTAFVGRRTDVDNLLNLLRDPNVRLVTVVGAGGVGKTRLALEVARKLQSGFRHGVVFVALASLASIDELLPALADALAIQLPPEADLEHVVLDHLSGRHVLLLLDNFEHLLEEALLVNEILAAGPHVKVLVTSREKLGLEAEHIYRLMGLELPPPDGGREPGDYDAVELFVRRARRARPGFELNAANAAAVIELCRLVDGNPLAILLAAAWAEHFSPAQIVEEIQRSLDFLSRDSRDAEPRHASMRAVFAASYNRLDAPRQAVFRSLAVFRGGFDLAAAEAVAGDDLRSLMALVNQCLLARDSESGRYDLHELLRQYAREVLESAGASEEAVAAHARYYTGFVHDREVRLISRGQVAAIDEIQADLDNIRQACSTVAAQRDFASAGAMLPGLYAFCDMRSRFIEGEAVFRLASESLAPLAGEAPHPVWALALLSWYDMRAYIEPVEAFEEMRRRAERCLEQARSLSDPKGIAASLVLLGAVAEDQAEFEAAIRLYEEAMRVYPPLDDAYWVNMRIGLGYQEIHKYPEAIRAFQISLQRGKEMGERAKTGWSLLNIGDTLMRQEKRAEAEQMLQQAQALFREIRMPLGVLCANFRLSRLALDLGNSVLARERAEIAAQLARQIHSSAWLEKIGELLRRIDPEISRASHGAGIRIQGLETFSPRELEVLQLLKSELTGPEIADRLVVSLNTVRYHTKNIYQKLGVNTRLEAIRRANELGL